MGRQFICNKDILIFIVYLNLPSLALSPSHVVITPFRAEVLFMKDNLMAETKSGWLLIPLNLDGFRLKGERKIHEQIIADRLCILFATFVTDAILACEEDANADHDDEDGEPKIETTVQNNLDIHSNLLSLFIRDARYFHYCCLLRYS